MQASAKYKIAIVVDAACDLPADFMTQNHIIVVPFYVATQTGTLLDDRNPNTMGTRYEQYLNSKTDDFVATAPLAPSELEDFFLKNIVLHYDNAIFISLTSKRSEMHKNISEAWFGITTKPYRARRDHGIKGAFNFEIVDSGTLAAGQGLLAYAAVEHLKTGGSLRDLKAHLEALSESIYIYGTPSDLLYMYTRAKAKNEKSITWGKYTLASLLGVKPILEFHCGSSKAVGRTRNVEEGFQKIAEHIAGHLKSGLVIKAITISYSGPTQEISSLKIFQQLNELVSRRNIPLLISQMSLTVAINLGERAIMVAFAVANSKFEA